jgi:predicted  nucleic acid-binding Zn-ribbon protein
MSQVDPPPPAPGNAAPRDESSYSAIDPLGEFGSEPDSADIAAGAPDRRTRAFNFDVPATTERRRGTGGSASQQITTLERRIAELTNKDRLLQQTAAFVSTLEHRASDTMAALQTQVSRSEGQRHVLEQSIAQSQQRVAATIADLDARIVRLTGSDGEIERADRTIGDLQQRVSDMRADIADRVAALSSERTRIEQSGAALEERAHHLTSEIDRRLNEITTRRREVEAAAAEAARTAAVLGELEVRLAGVKAEARDAASTTSQASADLDRLVARLEQQSVSTDAELDRANRARGDLERDIARLQTSLARATKAARRETGRLARSYRRNRRAQLASIIPADVGVASRVKTWLQSATQVRTVRRRETFVVIAVIAAAALLVIPWNGGTTPSTDSISSVVGAGVVAGAGVSGGIEPVLASRPLDMSPATPQVVPVATAGLAASMAPAALPPVTPEPVRAPAVRTTAPRVSRTNAVARDETRELAASDEGNASSFVGNLSIASTPAGARVFVDQRAVGVTPVVLNGLRVGSHVVRIEREGYARWTTAVTVSTVRATQVTAQLDRAR